MISDVYPTAQWAEVNAGMPMNEGMLSVSSCICHYENSWTKIQAIPIYDRMTCSSTEQIRIPRKNRSIATHDLDKEAECPVDHHKTTIQYRRKKRS